MSERIVARWSELDRAHALHGADRDAIRDTEPTRSLLIELVIAGDVPGGSAAVAGEAARASAEPTDLFTACARLGFLLAAAGASPALSAVTLDHAAAAMRELAGEGPPPEVWLGRGRAALFEGFSAGRADEARRAAKLAWECPACVVTLDPATVAIACGYPEDDADAVGDWAARTALHVSKRGAKRALLGGNALGQRELRDALGLMGIEVLDALEAPPRGLLGRIFG